MQHFTLLEHRIHDLTFGFLFVPGALGLLVQLRRPARNVAGMAIALIPWAGLLLAALLSDDFARVILFNPSRVVAALTLIAALLHPAGRHFFRSFSVSRVDWASLALVALAAVPLLAFASVNIGLHSTNESLLRGPIDRDRPQALLFDAEGRVLGVEYEVTTDAVPEAPSLFGRTFTTLAAHPGVEHEHYALHLWFIENPAGPFADFNPNVSCPSGTTPPHGAGGGAH
jgi:hypothetical protein